MTWTYFYSTYYVITYSEKNAVAPKALYYMKMKLLSFFSPLFFFIFKELMCMCNI